MNSLSLLCAVFIAGDWFGFREVSGWSYFWCWVGVICTPIKVGKSAD